MNGKRASEQSDEGIVDAAIKRTKKETVLQTYEVAFEGGAVYIDIAELVRIPPFAALFVKHYKKSVKRLLQEDGIESFNVTKANATRRLFVPKPMYSPKDDLRLVAKDAKMESFMDRAKRLSHPLVPPILTDEDLAFFVDALGEKHAVEMRGVRTIRGIYFKVRDVGRVFGTANIAEGIQRKHTKAKEGEDYVWFTVSSADMKRTRQDIFLPFPGLLRATIRSQLPGAERLCVWVFETVFIHCFGVADQKIELAQVTH